jgi:signal transduction histidine kinase
VKAVVGGEAVEILVSSPQSALSAPAFRALLWLVPAMFALGALLIAGIFLQVRYGLSPLLELRTQIGLVASGRLRELPPSPVEELQPVTMEINRLVEQNRKRLAETRLHFANLAHGLKTPVASLSLALDGDNDPRGEMRGLLSRIEHRIRHHLGRARGMLSDPTIGVTTHLRPRVDDILSMMSRLYADRSLDVLCDVDARAVLACAPEDVDEILGAIIDNAFKWAKTRVHVGSMIEGKMVVIRVDDDGPGIEDHRVAEAMRPGTRLDETVPGDGFGLSIARELVEMHGGTIVPVVMPDSGLRLSIRLPLASN